MSVPVMTIHSYDRGKLKKAMLAMTAEAEKVEADGYELMGYQVVESERCITTLYKKAAARAPMSESALVGD